jgi:hypothetical protein
MTQVATVLLLDMAVVLHMITPLNAKNFEEYAALQLLPFLKKQTTASTRRIDLVLGCL